MKGKFIWLATMAVILASCEKENLFEGETSPRQIDERESVSELTEGEIELGEKIESPLLLKNMQRAADSLTKKSGLRSAVSLSPTHLYVRFLPKDSMEYERVATDTLLDVTPYPLDYELTEGTVYYDPSLPKNSYQWQYAVVPVDYDLASVGVQYENLEELYMPTEMFEEENDENGQLRSATINSSLGFTLQDLLEEADRQTSPKEAMLKSKWTPGATITAYDDILGTIPLQGVTVRIRDFLFVKSRKNTDADGRVSFSRRRRRASYSIEWERSKWDIRDNGVQAYYQGPTKSNWWYLNICGESSKSLRYATIHRALYRYYYDEVYGLSRPLDDIKVDYISGKPTKDILGKFIHDDVRRRIEIYGTSRVSGEKNKVHTILSTTFHELTHASHYYRIGNDKYNKTKLYIRESWAVFAEWQLTRNEYICKGVDNKRLSLIDSIYQKQQWMPVFEEVYTPIFIDLYDKDNQMKKYGSIYPADEINYFMVGELDANVTSIFNFSDLKSYIYNKVGNQPDKKKKVETYLNAYNDIWN